MGIEATDPWTEFEANGRVKMKALAGHEVYHADAGTSREWEQAVSRRTTAGPRR